MRKSLSELDIYLSDEWWEEYERAFGEKSPQNRKRIADSLGKKDDQQKPKLFKGVLDLFPRSIKAVAEVSEFGSRKYDWTNWKYVEDGIDRYTDALIRHLNSESLGEEIDPETQLSHSFSVAWNALARLELMLIEKEKNNDCD